MLHHQRTLNRRRLRQKDVVPLRSHVGQEEAFEQLVKADLEQGKGREGGEGGEGGSGGGGRNSRYMSRLSGRGGEREGGRGLVSHYMSCLTGKRGGKGGRR